MSSFRKFCCAFLAAALFAGGAATEGFSATAPKVRDFGKEPHYVMILGNSLTFYNNGLHTMLRSMSRERAAEDERFVYRIITTSGGSLIDASFGFEQALTRQYKWDGVIFQGNSTEPIDEKRKDDFRKYALELLQVAKKNNIPAMFFANWGNPTKPETTGLLQEEYVKLGNETNTMVSPIGLAFAKAVAAKPGLQLIRDDNVHPTVEGSYLTAAMLYASLSKKSPEGLKYDADLGSEMAAFLQKTAWETCREFYGW